MKLFSGLFGNKKNQSIEKEVKNIEENIVLTPISEKFNVEKIAEDLSHFECTKHISQEIKSLAFRGDYSIKEHEKCVNKLLETTKNEKAKLISAQLSKDLVSEVEEMKNYTFNKKFNSFEKFYEDFPSISNELEILEKLNNNFAKILENEEIKLLYNQYKLLLVAFEKATKESQALFAEESTLTNDIIKYSNTVSELQRKYSLSIDWDGKKNMMISLGKKLSAKKESLLEREKILVKELEILYKGYPLMQSELLSQTEYIKQKLLDMVTDTYVEESEIIAIEKIVSKYSAQLKTLQ